MPSQEEIVRAAVRAALAKDAVLEGEASTSKEPRKQNCPKPLTTESAAKQAKRKKTGSTVPDSNWKKLQKSLTKPGHKPRRKRPRKQATDLAKPATPPDATFSAFMKRRVTATEELSRVVAIDCEMVGVGPDGKENALARVSVVNYSGDVLYDKLVRVHEPVTDYRTEFSGIRPGDVSPESADAVEPREAQQIVGELIRGRVLVGHALRNDLAALMLKHPWRDVRDTSEFYKKLWRRSKGRRSAKPPALRLVVASVLGVDTFQKEEHDSCEDARAALMLYKRNAKVWEAELRAKGVGKRRKEKKAAKEGE